MRATEREWETVVVEYVYSFYFYFHVICGIIICDGWQNKSMDRWFVVSGYFDDEICSLKIISNVYIS